MAREMGLSGLSNVMPKRGGKERESEPRSRQAIYFGRAEREIMRSGGYSWVGDIRARVALAKNTSRTEGEFRVALAKLGISVEDIAAAYLIYEKAKEQGLGTWLEI